MKVYEHPPNSAILQRVLHKALPYTVSLVYRTQHKNITPDAHILATFPPSLDPENKSIPHCWAAAYFDRSMRPETELWIFAAGEQPGHSSVSNSNSSSGPLMEEDPNSSLCPTCTTATLSLFSYMSTLPVPPLHPENLHALEIARQHEQEFPDVGPSAQYPISSATYFRHLLLPHVITLGAAQSTIVSLCQEKKLVCPEFPGPEALLNKFLFRLADLPKELETYQLPEGLRWGPMRMKDLVVVQSRTPIPRAAHTMHSLESIGVFNEADLPIAWVFLGLDGSLTTLHVEPGYRGRGIAKAVAARVLRERAKGFAVDDQGNEWAHADVYVGNTQSEAVCKSLGGRPMWTCFWVRVDVQRARGLVDLEL